MAVSVSWLVQQNPLELVRRAGPARPRVDIEFAQPTELQDPTRFLSGGELVLTTGLNFPTDEPSLAAYVERLHSAGVAALAFGIGLSHDAVPDAVVAAADRVGLPLLEVPLSTPFAAVTRAVMARLAEQEYQQVLDAVEVQTRITRAALRGGVAAIVRELAVATNASVVFLGERSLAVHPPTATEVVDEARTAIASRGPGDVGASVSSSGPGHAFTVQPVGAGGDRHGHLAVSRSRPLDTVDRILLGHTVSLLTIELEKPVRLRAERSRLNTMAVQMLLDGALTGDSIPAYLADAGDDRGRVRILSVRTDDVDLVRHHVDTALHRTGRLLFADTSPGEVTVVLRGTDPMSAATALLDHLPVPAAATLRAGLSAAHRIGDTAVAVDQARMAVERATRTVRIVEFDTAGGSALLASKDVRRALLTIGAGTVGLLARHDAAHRTSLVASLRAFLDANGQWEPAAGELAIHRHTLRARIVRCEELLGCDLGRAGVRAELLLALMAWETRNH